MAKASTSTVPAPRAGLFPVAVLAGTDLFLRRQAIAALSARFAGNDAADTAVIRLDGAAQMAAVLDECRTVSMFTARKIVIVDQADRLFKKDETAGRPGTASNREIMEHYIANPAEGAMLILAFDTWLKTSRLHKQLEPHSAVYSCAPPRPDTLPRFVIDRAKAGYGKNIGLREAQTLADLIGADLARLDNELAKLALYRPDDPAITAEAIDALVGFQNEREIWDLVDTLSRRDAAGALQKIDDLFLLDPNIKYTGLAAIFFFVGQVLAARECLDRGMHESQVSRAAKLWPEDRARRVIALAKNLQPDGADTIASAMSAADMANKSGLGDPRGNIEQFAVTFCAL